jgi:hypothetical protein
MQPMQCCETKDVGGVSYTLVGRMDTKSYQCINDCIYVKDEEPRVKFCFASGDVKVECTEDELQGSEVPPMEGSEKPPMEGTETPPHIATVHDWNHLHSLKDLIDSQKLHDLN